MQQETQQRTSQGEFIVQERKAELPTATEGVLSGLWHKVLGTTTGAVHMAEEVVHKAQESIPELLNKGLDKAHDAVMAGEKLAEQTKEFIELEVGKAKDSAFVEQVSTTAAELAHQAKELGSGAVDKAAVSSASIFEFASIIKEQAKESQRIKSPPPPEPSRVAIDTLGDKLQSLSLSGEPLVSRARSIVIPIPLRDKAADKVAPAPAVVDQAAPLVEQVKEAAAPFVLRALDTAAPLVEKAKEVVAPLVEKALDTAAPLLDKASNIVSSSSSSVPTPVKRSNSSRSLKRSSSKQSGLTSTSSDQGWNAEALVLTMDVVSHIQRIADRTGDGVLHETARRAHSACAKGLSEAPGVHLTWITPQQANDLVNLAIRTQDHELADFARYCQSVAATTHIGVEPTPGKIQEEILKGYQELQQQGRIHTGPGYGAAFASVNKTYQTTEGGETTTTSTTPTTTTTSSTLPPLSRSSSTSAIIKPSQQKRSLAKHNSMSSLHEQAGVTKPELVLTMEVVSHIQRIADRTGNPVLHDTARKAHSACAKGLNDFPGVHLTWIVPAQASELMNLASKTQDQELIDFARYCQSVAATTQVGVEPTPGKIQQEILKGRELQLLQEQQPTEQQPTQPSVQAL